MKKLFFIYNEKCGLPTTNPYTSKSRLLKEFPLGASEKVVTITEGEEGFDELYTHREALCFVKNEDFLGVINRLNPAKEPDEAAEALYLKLVDAGIIDDNRKNVGRTVFALTRQKSVFDICRAIEEFFGVETLREADYDAIMHLYVTYVC